MPVTLTRVDCLLGFNFAPCYISRRLTLWACVCSMLLPAGCFLLKRCCDSSQMIFLDLFQKLLPLLLKVQERLCGLDLGFQLPTLFGILWYISLDYHGHRLKKQSYRI